MTVSKRPAFERQHAARHVRVHQPNRPQREQAEGAASAIDELAQRSALVAGSRVIGSHSRVGRTRPGSMPLIRSSLLQSRICASDSASDFTFASTAPPIEEYLRIGGFHRAFQASRASRAMVARMQE